jgi:hypothetical protein
MCIGGPKAPKAPPPPAAAPRQGDEGVQRARGDEKRRLRMLAGRQSTLLTGGSGLSTQASTTGTLLGGG